MPFIRERNFESIGQASCINSEASVQAVCAIVSAAQSLNTERLYDNDNLLLIN